jgi:DNA-binding NarL/FixJ family response regulator
MGAEIRILTADDHQPFLAALRQIVTAEPDFRIIGECADGIAALLRIFAERPDVAVLDVEMPGMDGIAVTEKLAASGAVTRAIILTMHKEENLLRHARKLGAWGYLLKENAAFELAPAIRAVVAGIRFGGRSCAAFEEEIKW